MALPRPASGRVVRFDVTTITPLGAIRALASGDVAGYEESRAFLQGMAISKLSATGMGSLTPVDSMSK